MKAYGKKKVKDDAKAKIKKDCMKHMDDKWIVLFSNPAPAIAVI